MPCELCEHPGGQLVASSAAWRVIRVMDADFPAFYRVVWQQHVVEFSELEVSDRMLCMEVVARVEQVLRESLQPQKVNLASLGNMVPHLHWHIVARFAWDSHFPHPIWAPRQRVLPAGADAASRLCLPMARVDEAVKEALRTL